ncbi:BMC domain-containing protein [Enterococcus ratti]|uniref:BMC domain-containing protein n=1 Tax=Enterococcus ratti TaxID=150033 RepID=UPI003511CC7A
MKAIGMIEVRGFLGAIGASDAALKAADVQLLNAESIRGGLTTVQLGGDVAAVYAAVDAGVAVAKKLDCLISHHVIPRVAKQTEQILTKAISKKIKKEPKKHVDENQQEAEKAIAKTDLPDQPTDKNERITELQAKRVSELRKEAYQLNVKQLKPSEIKSASKQALINAILAEIKGSDR